MDEDKIRYQELKKSLIELVAKYGSINIFVNGFKFTYDEYIEMNEDAEEMDDVTFKLKWGIEK